MDWITLAIELIGLFILVLWTVIPLQEFRAILRQIRHRPDVSPTEQGRE